MNVVSFVLFLHVVGMLGLFVALGLDGHGGRGHARARH
jgi:hypothetical protein